MTATRERVALNADVVGYSRLLADDRDGTTRMMEECRHLVEEQVRSAHGTLVNFVGDNFMAVFDDAIDAVRCAIDIASRLESGSEGVASDRRVRFRMGIDVGDVVTVDGQYFGDALNVAARIQAIAPAGGLSISGAMYRALDEPALRFRPTGRRGLKGIPEEVEVYEFADLPSDAAGSTDRAPMSLGIPSVAVLPAHDEAGSPVVLSAAEVLRSELLHLLSRVPQLDVIDARSEPEAGGVGRLARYLIETGVHELAGSARVYATLMDVTTMNIVKSLRWVGRTEELFEAAERLATDMAQAVDVEIVVGEPAGLYAELNDPEAIENVYLGWYHMTSGTPEGWERSLQLFGEVASHHPEQPFGFVLLAFAHWMGANNDWSNDPDASLNEAYDLAVQGEKVGDPTGMARMVRAAVLMSRGQGREALEAVEGTEIIRPTCDATYGLEGSVRRYLGQWDESVDLEDTAMRLTGVTKPWYPTVKGCSLYLGGRAEQAAAVIEMVLEHQPNNLEALLVLAGAQAEMGLERRARATAEIISQRFPSVDVAAWLDRRPFANPSQVERWKENLRAAGVLEPA